MVWPSAHTRGRDWKGKRLYCLQQAKQIQKPRAAGASRRGRAPAPDDANDMRCQAARSSGWAPPHARDSLNMSRARICFAWVWSREETRDNNRGANDLRTSAVKQAPGALACRQQNSRSRGAEKRCGLSRIFALDEFDVCLACQNLDTCSFAWCVSPRVSVSHRQFFISSQIVASFRLVPGLVARKESIVEIPPISLRASIAI
jgi:hypothetical protein